MTTVRSRRIAVLALAVCALAPAVAHAATFTVDTTADNPALTACTAAANDCSFRGAIVRANADANVGAPDVIALPDGTYGLAATPATVTENVDIVGTSTRGTILDLGNVVGTAVNANNADLRLENLTVRNAAETSAAVVSADNDEDLELVRAQIVDNRNAAVVGGRQTTIVESTIARNTGFLLGGVAVIGEDGVLVMRRSTVADNVAKAPPVAGPGEVIFAGGVLGSCVVIIDDSTIARNRAEVASDGITLGGNLAIADGLGAGCGQRLQVVRNTIIAGGLLGTGPADCSGASFVSNGGNLDSDGSCGFDRTTDASGVDPLLAPLANNGGPTDTVALLEGSPAIDTGSGCVGVDQRGVARPAGGACDKGAFESPFTKPAPAPTAPAAPAAPAAPPAPVGPVTPAGPTPDTTAPTVTLSRVASTVRRAAFRRGFTGRVATSEAATVEIALVVRSTRATIARVGDLVVGETALRRGTNTRSFRVKPSTRLVPARGKRFRATLVVTATDAAGNRRVVRRTVTVR